MKFTTSKCHRIVNGILKFNIIFTRQVNGVLSIFNSNSINYVIRYVVKVEVDTIHPEYLILRERMLL